MLDFAFWPSKPKIFYHLALYRESLLTSWSRQDFLFILFFVHLFVSSFISSISILIFLLLSLLIYIIFFTWCICPVDIFVSLKIAIYLFFLLVLYLFFCIIYFEFLFRCIYLLNSYIILVTWPFYHHEMSFISSNVSCLKVYFFSYCC